mgnify:CR=1 FL=1
MYRSSGTPGAGPAGNHRADDLLVVVNLDPHQPHETTIHVPLPALGLREGHDYVVEDVLTGTLGTVGHEFQHLISASRRLVRCRASGSTAAAATRL